MNILNRGSYFVGKRIIWSFSKLLNNNSKKSFKQNVCKSALKNKFFLDEFPLMVDVWEDMFGIDIEEGPQLGLIDISEVLSKVFSFQLTLANDPYL